MLSPMPLAITTGTGSNPIPYTMPAVENINGQAITLAMKHKDKRDPKDWKGFKFGVPFDYSMHNRSEEHTSELQSLMRISYAVFCLKKKKNNIITTGHDNRANKNTLLQYNQIRRK